MCTHVYAALYSYICAGPIICNIYIYMIYVHVMLHICICKCVCVTYIYIYYIYIYIYTHTHTYSISIHIAPWNPVFLWFFFIAGGRTAGRRRAFRCGVFATCVGSSRGSRFFFPWNDELGTAQIMDFIDNLNHQILWIIWVIGDKM